MNNKNKAGVAMSAMPVLCPTCGQPIAAGKPHAKHGYKDLKMKLDGYLKPGQSLHRNMLFDVLYDFIPKDPKAQIQVYNYEIAPGAFTNWHIHTGATFYLTLQGMFEGHFEEGVLIHGNPGEVYSEPIGKIHRGHNPHAEIILQGIGIAITSPHIAPIINVEPPAWAASNAKPKLKSK